MAMNVTVNGLVYAPRSSMVTVFSSVAHICPRPPLDGVQLLGVRGALAIEPELVVEADRVDDERVLLPTSRSSARTRSGRAPPDACGHP